MPAQHAAIAAFTEQSYAEAAAAVTEFADARALLLDAVGALGWTGVAPADGAFYVYADIGDRLAPYPDSEAWCAALLEEEGVALTPGTDFDRGGRPDHGPGLPRRGPGGGRRGHRSGSTASAAR